MRYVNIQKHWRKLGPLYKSQVARGIWLPNMLEFAAGRLLNFFRESGTFSLGFLNGMARNDEKVSWGRWENITCPQQFDPSDWRHCEWHKTHRGRSPKFFDYTCFSACHFLVDLHLFVITNAYPELPWRIITSDEHSTVWDGKNLILDGNFLAFGISADKAFEAALYGKNAEVLSISEFRGIFGRNFQIVERMAKRRGLI